MDRFTLIPNKTKIKIKGNIIMLYLNELAKEMASSANNDAEKQLNSLVESIKPSSQDVLKYAKIIQKATKQLDNLKLKDIDSIDDMEEYIGSLYSAMSEIRDGTAKISNNLKDFRKTVNSITRQFTV